jgi:hypothetical protein
MGRMGFGGVYMNIFRVSVTSVDGKWLFEEFAHSNKHAERIASNWNHLDVKINKTLFQGALSPFSL